MIFSCEDIHNLRIEMAERYAKMSPEEAERDFQESVANALCAIEEIRRQKDKAVV